MRRLPRLVALLLTLAGPVAAPAPAPAAPLADGVWEGRIVNTLRARIRIATDAGVRTATFDSPDQGASGIPLAIERLTDDSLVVTLAAAQARYAARIEEDGRLMRGHWSQAGQRVELDLRRLDQAPTDAPPPVVRRPQEPLAPFPYDTVEVVVRNPTQGNSLTGTLTIPRGARGRVPAVVLVSGSGTQDRDETHAGHRPFKLLADRLTRAGFAVLRYDDRGMGGSTGAGPTVTTHDFATDAAAAVAHLRGTPAVDPRRVFVVGHSEGGLIAMLVAAADPRLAGIALLAGPAVRGDSLMASQSLALLRATGADAATIARTSALNRGIWEHMAADTPADTVAARTRRHVRAQLADWPDAARATLGDPDAFVRRTTLEAQVPWLRAFVRLDPAPRMARIRVPVLALHGALDLQVPPAVNAPALAAAFRGSRARLLTERTLPGLNHMFQTARTGLPDEYGALEETFAPAALAALEDWLRQRARLAP